MEIYYPIILEWIYSVRQIYIYDMCANIQQSFKDLHQKLWKKLITPNSYHPLNMFLKITDFQNLKTKSEIDVSYISSIYIQNIL